MNQKAICIIGMHRSGTSTISRAVNLLGAYLGEERDMMKPRADNPEGFWERQDIANLDDKILAAYKKDWDCLVPQPEGWHKSEEAAPLRAEVKALLATHFSGKPLWAWKDPRTTVVFEIWKEAVAELGAALACLVVVRNPLDVARSHQKRDGFSLEKGFGVWFNYNLAALRSTADVKRSFISYDSFLADWEGELKRCAAEIDVPWPEDDTELKARMNEFIKPGLRHSLSGLNELKESGAPRPVIELHSLLEDALLPGFAPDGSFNKRLAALSAEFNDYATIFKMDMEALWEHRRTVPALNAEIHRLNQEKARIMEEMNRQLEEKENERRRQVEEKERHIEAREGIIEDRNRQIELLLNSMSWKITAPLRKVVGMLKS